MYLYIYTCNLSLCVYTGFSTEFFAESLHAGRMAGLTLHFAQRRLLYATYVAMDILTLTAVSAPLT